METIKEIIDVIENKEISQLVIALVILVAFILGGILISKLICRLLKMRKSQTKNSSLYKILKIIFSIIGVYASILFLQLPQDFMNFLGRIIKIILIILITKLLADCINPKTNLLNKIIKDERRSKSSVNFITKILKGLIYTIGIFIIISELGYDLSGIVTGLGLSGVVIALAAQDIAKNLFAGFIILTDKTFLVGDYIEIDTISGNIEDIGFRTTRMRTMDNSLVTLPNSLLADGKVMNWSRNVKRKYEFNLRFELNSDIAVLKEISNRIKFILKTNKDIITEDIHVNFTQILNDSINLNVYFYTPIVEFSKYLEFKSEINITILSLLEKEGIKLAYPTQMVNIHNMENNMDM